MNAPRSARLDGWSDGYTTDVVYTDELSSDLCPAWFSMIAMLNGQPPLPTDRPLVWLDLASGTGVHACTVAATNPNIEVWGIDYNPAHIERSRQLAAAAGLTNCTFVEASFEEAARDGSLGPDEVDVAVLNGVYSWVSATNRRHAVAAAGRRLRPGGIAYVMYETATGWASMVPLAEAMRLLVDADGRRGDIAFYDAAAQLVALRDAGAAFFPIGPGEAEQVERWSDASNRYAAHEYLGANFEPLHTDAVVAAMADHKCGYLGGMHPLDHHPYYSLPPDMADVLQGATDRLVQEMVRDVVLQTALRRDLFRRGHADPTGPELRRWLESLQIVGLGKVLDDEPIPAPAMSVSLDRTFHGPLVDALADGPLDVGAVCRLHPDWSFADAVSALALLVAGGFASPSLNTRPSDQVEATSRRLNRVLAEHRRNDRQLAGVVSPVTGAVVHLDLVEVLALDAIHAGTPTELNTLVAEVQAVFAAQGLVVQDRGQRVTDDESARTILVRRVSELLARRPTLERLGAG